MNAYPATDVLVIGAGIAGASAALRLADAGRHVTLLARTPLSLAASAQALGGIAAAIGPDDSPALHLQDTVSVGAGLCREATVRGVVERAPAMIQWLIAQGVEFDASAGALDLGREGGHGQRRIVHCADATGRGVMAALIARLRTHANIVLLEGHAAVNLLTAEDVATPGGHACRGAQVLDETHGLLGAIHAEHVILATGGASGVYSISTNAARPVGDGIALAWRAGCAVADLEMVQFHPTALCHPEAQGWLVTEAVRGEGGRLLLPGGGERFMFRHDARGELAPRDVVARAIHAEMRDRGLDFVWLDISHADAHFIRAHFPNTLARCAELGIDITREPMPVAPAAHYTCGGVVTGGAGETAIPGLYAIGEVAWTGLHGANRLASNSLLEGLVYAEAASAAILADVPRPALRDTVRLAGSPRPVIGRATEEARGQAAGIARAIRQTMSAEVGIVRSDAGLAAAIGRLEALAAQAEGLHARHDPDPGLLELRNLACVATLVARSAALRQESRGAHFNRDHPRAADLAVNTILRPGRGADISRRRAVA
jgi:L-aspartate oxidase